MSDLGDRDLLSSPLRPDNPFFRRATLYMPRSIYTALRMAQYIYNSMGMYRSAMERVLSYFLTDIELKGEITDDQRKDYLDFLHRNLHIMPVLFEVGSNYLCYGNVFISVQPLVNVYVNCPRCAEKEENTEFLLKYVIDNKEKFDYKFVFPEISLRCPKCDFNGVWHSLKRPYVQRKASEEEIVIQIWNPLEIEIIHDPYTKKNQYVWKIPGYYKDSLRQGVPHILVHTPWEIMEAAATTERLLFYDDEILHLKEPSLAGIREAGWGYPRTLINFREIYQLELLMKYNEALTSDYLMPMRVVSPAPIGRADPNAVGGDILANIDGQVFKSQVKQMITQHRRDPASWQISPWPLQYQILGGEARQLVPHELLQTTLDMLLTAINVPVELYKGSISHQAMPMAIRMFESSWTHLVHTLNMALDWIVQKVQNIKNWEPVLAKLTRPFYADDVRRQAMIMNLAAAQEISRTTAFQSLGLDFREEAIRLLEEQKFLAQTQFKFQEELEEMQLGGIMGSGQAIPLLQQIELMHQQAEGGGLEGPPQQGQPGGQPGAAQGAAQGAPPQGGGMMAAALPVMQSMGGGMAAASTTPQELLAQAQQIAQQLLSMPESQRFGQLVQLKRANPVLHAMVKQIMSDIRQQAAAMGKAQIMQQQFGTM